jgi:hypothetical protein
MAATAPPHFVGREALDLVAGGDGRLRVGTARQPCIVGEWSRHQRSGMRGGSERCAACGKPQSEFQKVPAFHPIIPPLLFEEESLRVAR